MGALLGTVFIASLLGSLHCVGMCGPFAMLASAADRKRSAYFLPTTAYSCGRLLTYSVVGLIFGALGMALNNGTSFANWQQSATLVAGLLMISIGMVAFARHWGIKIKLPKNLLPIKRVLKAGFTRTQSMPPMQRAFSIGALTSLMPCGWLYTFAIAAAGTGSPTKGLLVMVVFWAGTVPIMTALMLGMDRIGTSLRSRLPVFMASLVIVIGIFTLAYRAPITLGQEPQVVVGTSLNAAKIQTIDHAELPCCQSEQEAKK